MKTFAVALLFSVQTLQCFAKSGNYPVNFILSPSFQLFENRKQDFLKSLTELGVLVGKYLRQSRKFPKVSRQREKKTLKTSLHIAAIGALKLLTKILALF